MELKSNWMVEKLAESKISYYKIDESETNSRLYFGRKASLSSMFCMSLYHLKIV